MKYKKPLTETNPYLKDPKQRAELIKMSVLSSSAVEGIYFNITSFSCYKSCFNQDHIKKIAN